jgi:hypothetical protein
VKDLSTHAGKFLNGDALMRDRGEFNSLKIIFNNLGWNLMDLIMAHKINKLYCGFKI